MMSAGQLELAVTQDESEKWLGPDFVRLFKQG